MFALWKNEACPSDIDTWHEIARPQVHGHDINCVTIIRGKGNHRYVSGADEKVARVFEAPLSFLKTLNAISQNGIAEDLQTGVQVLGANMSALGLSQKPIYVQCKSIYANVEHSVGKIVNGLASFSIQLSREPQIELAMRTLTHLKLFLTRSR